MKLLVAALSLLILSPSAFGQGAANASAPYDQQVTSTTSFTFIDTHGIQWKQTCVETKTVTYTQVTPSSTPGTTPPATPTPAPTPTPVVTPPVVPVVPVVPPTSSQVSGYLPSGDVAAGSLLSIKGAGFGALTGTATGRVIIGGADAIVKSWADTLITCLVPTIAHGSTSLKVYVQSAPASSPTLLAVGPDVNVTALPASP